MKDKKSEQEVVIDGEKMIDDENHQERNQDKKKPKKEKKKKKNDELLIAEDKYLRLFAEYDNYRKRTTKEMIVANDKGKIVVIKEFLDVIDNFERALNISTQDQEFRNGIELIYKTFRDKLKNLGLEEINCDDKLDSKIHHAVATDNLDDYEDDQIIEVMQKGYILEEQLIRPAMVKVNKK